MLAHRLGRLCLNLVLHYDERSLPAAFGDEVHANRDFVRLLPITCTVSRCTVIQRVNFHTSPSNRGYVVDSEGQWI